MEKSNGGARIEDHAVERRLNTWDAMNIKTQRSIYSERQKRE